LICLADDENRLIYLDEETFNVVHGVNIGKKVIMSSADTNVYVCVAGYILIYDWHGDKISQINVSGNMIPTNLLEFGTKLMITDGFGQALIFSVELTNNAANNVNNL
jgi:hypothetical protein